MKKLDKNKFKKQLVSGGIYIALAAAVVTVTLNGVNSIIGEQDYEVPNTNLELPEVNFEGSFPNTDNISSIENPFDVNLNTENIITGTETVVSGAPEGINAETKDEEKKPESTNQEAANGIGSKDSSDNKESTDNDNGEKTEKTTEDNVTASGEPDDVEYPTEPEYDNYGVYAKPADGYIDREFSLDELLYSPTMGDYRTHNGVDITGDIGSAVRAVSAGIVEDVYYDNFYGHTVVINHGDGVLAYYMNLSESIPQGIEKGAHVEMGQTIGGIGESAIIESADVSHLHFSVTCDGKYIDPGEFLRG